MSPTTSALAWTTEEVPVAGSSVRLRTAGRGAPLLVLHHEGWQGRRAALLNLAGFALVAVVLPITHFAG